MGTGLRFTCLSAVTALMLCVSPVHAQIVRTTFVVVTVPRLSQLVPSGDVSGLLTLTVDSSAETAYDFGYAESAPDATVLTLSTNDRWDLSARRAGAWTCPGTYDKSESDLFIRITNTPTGTVQNGANSYINLAETDTPILSHDTSVSGNVVQLQTKVLLDWTKDVPGAYSVTLTYTLVTHVP
jgi:hypothetical protein